MSRSHAHEHHHEHTPARRPAPASGHTQPQPADGRHKDHRTHDRHAGHSVAMFRDKFWITLLLAIPTLVWSEMLQQWFGFTAPAFPGSAYIAAGFGTAVYLYGGWVFLAGGARELRDRLPGMMTLISIAISVAFLFSLAVTLGYPDDPLWWELATLVTIMLLGHWIEMRSIFQASGALRELARLLPSTAEKIVGERVDEVLVSDQRPAASARPAVTERPESKTQEGPMEETRYGRRVDVPLSYEAAVERTTQALKSFRATSSSTSPSPDEALWQRWRPSRHWGSLATTLNWRASQQKPISGFGEP